jgi:hypothetical protein
LVIIPVITPRQAKRKQLSTRVATKSGVIENSDAVKKPTIRIYHSGQYLSDHDGRRLYRSLDEDLKVLEVQSVEVKGIGNPRVGIDH